ncbi:MAG TPA: hypothetical protein DEQ47_08720 [Solibacterales bacterium]|nr:hypothetical protein [Bryobacterales bacterium]
MHSSLEVLRRVDAGRAKAVLFDFDGTLSLIRAGGVNVMAANNDGQIFVCGNGGSAAIASHFATDMLKGASWNRHSDSGLWR